MSAVTIQSTWSAIQQFGNFKQDDKHNGALAIVCLAKKTGI